MKRIFLYILIFVAPIASLFAQNTLSLSYGQMRAWFVDNGFGGVENPDSTELSSVLGRHLLKELRDRGGNFSIRPTNAFEDGFNVFRSITMLDDFHLTEPRFAGHYQLLLNAAGRNLSFDQRFRIYAALQLVWAAQASDPDNLRDLESMIQKVSTAFQNGDRRVAASGDEILSTLTDLGIPLSRDGETVNPIWRAWDLQEVRTHELVGINLEVPYKVISAKIVDLAAAHDIPSAELTASLIKSIREKYSEEELSDALVAKLVEIFVQRSPGDGRLLARAARRDQNLRDEEILNSEERMNLIFNDLVDISIERIINPPEIAPVAAANASHESPARETPPQRESRRFLSPEQLREFLETHFKDQLVAHETINHDQTDGEIIKDPRLELLHYLIEEAVRLAESGKVEVPMALYYPNLRNWRYDITRLFFEVLEKEMGQTEVFQGQLERLLPQVTRRRGEDENAARQGIAFLLAAWATGAENKNEFLEFQRHGLLNADVSQWLTRNQRNIFRGEEGQLAPDVQNWVYFLPVDQYENLNVDPRKASETQWIVAHLTASLFPGGEAETIPSLEKQLWEAIDWSKASAGLKDNIEAQQALVKVFLTEKYEDEKDFGNRANKSRLMKEFGLDLRKNYLKDFYREAIGILRIKLQTPSIATRDANQEKIRIEIERFLFRHLGQAPENSLRSELVRLGLAAIYEGKIYFNPQWLESEPAERWVSYILSETLKLGAASRIRGANPGLAEHFSSLAPELKIDGYKYSLDSSAGCRKIVSDLIRRLTGLRAPMPVPATAN